MAKKLQTVADVQTVQKIVIRLRGTVAISRDYPDREVPRDLVNTTMAAWAEELATALRTPGKQKPAPHRPAAQLRPHPRVNP